MSNIILPKVQILDTIGDEAKILIEQDGEINRFAVANLGGGDISINLEDTINGNANPINADTLNGYTAKELFRPKAGFIYPLAGSVIPEGFLLCDGAEYGRTEFSELFAAIGTIYGNGNGSTTFNVPNLQTRVPVGAGEGYGLGAVGGEATHTLTVDEMPSHGHLQRVNGTGADTTQTATVNTPTASTYNNNYGFAGYTGNAGGSQPHNNMQPYTVVNYIIATGKDTGVSVSDIIMGAQAIPLGVEYGGTGATNAEDALKNLGALSMELRWKNASPMSAFPAQNIDVDLSGGKYALIGYKPTNSNDVTTAWELAEIGMHIELSRTLPVDNYYKFTISTRDVWLYPTYVRFGNGKEVTYVSNPTDSTNFLIPLEIYIIKGVSA